MPVSPLPSSLTLTLTRSTTRFSSGTPTAWSSVRRRTRTRRRMSTAQPPTSATWSATQPSTSSPFTTRP
eukprot:scaffold138922_cov105-Phaeocystis_antarctica.AAC.1